MALGRTLQPAQGVNVTVAGETLHAISTPDRVESRLGTLEFDDGAPSEETAALLYDHTEGVDRVLQR